MRRRTCHWLAAAVLLGCGFVASALAAPTLELRPRIPLPKPAKAVQPPMPSKLTVKFADELKARVVEGRLVSASGGDLRNLHAVLARHSLRYEPLIRLSTDKIEDLERRAAARSGVAQPDLAGMLVVESAGADLEAAARDLLQLVEVEWVEFSVSNPPPPCADVMPATPHYFDQGLQGYHGPDPGVDAGYAWNLGSTGQGVQIADCEYGYIHGTEDLCAIIDEPGQTPHPDVEAFGWDDHGTAVLGEMVSIHNDYGISGLAPDSSARFFTEWSVEQGSRRETAITNAIASVDPGDIVVLEMQISIGFGFGPAELSLSVWTITRVGTDAGVIVIGAAGNGNEDLDGPDYAEYRSRGDSGAILVGAGTPDVFHNRLGFSTYGSRINLQGWGTGVFTAGYGTYAEVGGDRLQRYTTSFSGTSSATPIVAASAAVLQSLAETSLGCRFTPLAMRQLMVDTGVPQGTGGHIGPLPDLREASDLVLALDDCNYTAAVCGNGAREGGEACDGTDTGSCPASCLPDCSCAALTPGEATDLRLLSMSQSTGKMTIAWQPACVSSQNTIVFGPLASVSSYGYTGQVCNLGNTGQAEGLLLGPDSYFFLIVANNGNGHEGSYGRDSENNERPEDLGDPTCALTRTLQDRCD